MFCVECVSERVEGLEGRVVGADLPHFLGYEGYFGRVGQVVREGFHAP